MYRKSLTLSLTFFLTILLMPHIVNAQITLRGPWLWMIAPTEPGKGGAESTEIDSLHAASGGAVTELNTAFIGTREGETVGNYQWTRGELPENGDLHTMLMDIGMTQDHLTDHSCYGLITIVSPREQEVYMFVSSDDSIKVWNNGQVIHRNAVNRSFRDSDARHDFFILKIFEGENLLMVKVSQGKDQWGLKIDIPPGCTTKLPNADPTQKSTYNGYTSVDGPYIWMVSPVQSGRGGAAATDVDSLSTASNGTVTETDIVINGAREGDTVGNYQWTPSVLPINGDINEMFVNIGMTDNYDLDHHTSYALITIVSETDQRNVPMAVNSDDSIKVWLNGQVVYRNAIDRPFRPGHQDRFSVNLNAGDNLMMVKVSDAGVYWNMWVGIDAEFTTSFDNFLINQPINLEEDVNVSEPSDSEDTGVAEPRTVRLVYFLPTDWPFEADRPEKIREEVRKVQAFYAEQMEAHGYGKRTFRVETDEQGEMIVHRLNGKHAFDHYQSRQGSFDAEIYNSFNPDKIYCIISGTDGIPLPGISLFVGGVGGKRGKNSGRAIVPKGFVWKALAHELGHAFGLLHDFRNGKYVMAYGSQTTLSACSAKYLSMHPYFNSEIPLEEGEPPTVEILSQLRYPEGTKSFPVRLRVSDPKGVSQVHLALQTNLIACRELEGEKEAIVEFDYKGVFLNSSVRFTRVVDRPTHILGVRVINTAGDISYSNFYHAQISPYYIDTLVGNNFPVLSLSFSPDSTILASGLEDGTIQLWDVQSRTIIRTFFRGGAPLGHSPILFSPTAPIIASATSDDRIQLWDIKTGEIIQTFSGHIGGITSFAFSPDGRTLASGAWDYKTKLWDVETGENFATLLGARSAISSLAFSPDGKSLAGGIYLGNILIWDIESGEMRKQIASARNSTITSVSYSLDGKLLASGSSDWKVNLWDAETGNHIKTLGGREDRHKGAVHSVSFLNNKLLVSGSNDATVKVWEVDSGANIETLSGAVGQIYSVSFSPDQTILAAGTSTNHIELWDLNELNQVYLDRDTEANIPDPSLRKAVAATLGRSPNDPILKKDMLNLSALTARAANISDLTGLELATNLTYLSIYNNSITDISALADLTGLEHLDLSSNSITNISALADLTLLKYLSIYNNSISDISALADLTDLEELVLSDSTISDISALADLTELTYLYLYNNSISDISALAGLTNLTQLYLYNNSISDISALAGLTNLTHLDLSRNLISDLSPLIENADLGKKHILISLGSNLLSYASVHTHIPLLQERGITVYYSDLTHPAVLKVSGDNQEGDAGMPLDQPFVVEVQDEKGVLSPGVPVTFTVTAGGGRLSATTVTTDANGRAETTLTLGTTPGKNTVQVTATEITQSVLIFNAIAIEEEPVPVVLKVSGDDQEEVAGKTLSDPLIVAVQDEHGQPMQGVTVTFTIDTGEGKLNPTTTKTDVNGEAQTTFTLGPTPGTSIIRATATGLETYVRFTATTLSDRPVPPSIATVSLKPQIVESPAIGEQLTFSLKIADGKSIAGYQAIVNFDATTLRYVSGANGDYLPSGAFFIPPKTQGSSVTLAATSLAGEINGNGTLATITFEVVAVKTSTVRLSDVILTNSKGETTQSQTENAEITAPTQLLEDVNGDGVVNIVDLTLVATNFGATGTNAADVNDDGVVNIVDLTLVAAAFGNTAAAPFTWSLDSEIALTRSDVEAWLNEARQLNLSDPNFQRGILVLESLLKALTPKMTALLPNYPNPFNPETWIPYQLAIPSDVSLLIYASDGKLIRKLELGHQPIGKYHHRSNAAHWDGKNVQGEPVASGVYFYTFTAGEFSATRKMLIRK